MAGKKKFGSDSKYKELKRSLALKIMPETISDEFTLDDIIMNVKGNTQTALGFFFMEHEKFTKLPEPVNGVCSSCGKEKETKTTKAGRIYGGLEYSKNGKTFCRNCFKNAWSLFTIQGKYAQDINNPNNVKSSYITAAFDTASPIFTKWATDDRPRFNERLETEIADMTQKLENIENHFLYPNRKKQKRTMDLINSFSKKEIDKIINAYSRAYRSLGKKKKTKEIFQEEAIQIVSDKLKLDVEDLRIVVLFKKAEGLQRGIDTRQKRMDKFNTSLPICKSNSFQIRCSSIKFMVDPETDTPLVGISHPTERGKWLRFKVMGKDFQWAKLKQAIKEGYAQKVYPEVHRMVKKRMVGKKLKNVSEYYIVFPLRRTVLKPRVTKDMHIVSIAFSPYAICGCLYKNGKPEAVKIFNMKKYRIRERKYHRQDLLKSAADYFRGNKTKKAVMKRWIKIKEKPKKKRQYIEDVRRFGFRKFQKGFEKKEMRFVNYVNHNITRDIMKWIFSFKKPIMVAAINYKFIKNVNYKKRSLQFEFKNWSVAKQYEYIKYKLLFESIPFELLKYKDTSTLQCYKCGHVFLGDSGDIKTLTEKMKLRKTFKCPECNNKVNFMVNDSLRIANLMEDKLNKSKVCKCGTALDFAPGGKCVFCTDEKIPEENVKAI